MFELLLYAVCVQLVRAHVHELSDSVAAKQNASASYPRVDHVQCSSGETSVLVLDPNENVTLLVCERSKVLDLLFLLLSARCLCVELLQDARNLELEMLLPHRRGKEETRLSLKSKHNIPLQNAKPVRLPTAEQRRERHVRVRSAQYGHVARRFDASVAIERATVHG